MRRALRSSAGLAAFTWFLLLASPSSPHAQADDRAEIEKQIERVASALHEKDLDGVMACWSPRSPEAEGFKAYVQNFFSQADTIEIANLATSRWEVQPDTAKVRLRFDWRLRLPKTHDAVTVKSIWDLRLVKEGQAWKIWQRDIAPAKLLHALIEAKTKEERARLLGDERELASGDLARELYLRGDRDMKHGQFDDALRLNDIALEVAGAIGDEKERTMARALCRYFRSTMYFFQEKYDDSMTNCEAALCLFGAAGDKRGTLNTKNVKGGILLRLGRLDDALTVFNDCLRDAIGMHDAETEGNVRHNIGNIRIEQGNYPAALEEYTKCAEVARQLPGRTGQEIYARAMSGMGLVFSRTGKYGAALAHFRESLKAYQGLGLDAEEAEALRRQGVAFAKVGQLDQAEESTLAAFLRFMKANSKREAISSLIDCGSICYSRGNELEAAGQHREAIGKYNVAAALFRLSEDLAGQEKLREEEAQASTMMGVVEDTVGRHEEALKQYESAKSIYLGLKDVHRVAEIDTNIGTAYFLIGDRKKALASYEESLRNLNPFDIDSVAKCWWGIGDVYRAETCWEKAIHAYKEAIRRIELAREQTGAPSLKISYFTSMTPPYYHLADCLLHLDPADERHVAEAFAVSERAKSRTLAEILGGAKFRVMDDAERQAWEELNGRISALTHTPPSSPREKRDELEKRRDDLRRQRDEFRLQLFLKHPDLQDKMARFEPASLEELDRTLFAAEPRLCLLSYLVGDDQVLLFVIARGEAGAAPARLTIHRIPFDAKARDRVRLFVNACSSSTASEEQSRACGQPLYQSLLKPAERELAGKSHLIVLPDVSLLSLPFHALVDGQGKYLIERYAVSYAPSATALLKMWELGDRRRREAADTAHRAGPQGRQPSPTLLAMGNPKYPDNSVDLPDKKVEADQIAKLFRAEALTGCAATEEAAKGRMGSVSYVHFATHGVFDEEVPLESYVLLAEGGGEDGFLHASELLELPLRAQLVVLSACDTARGEAVRGEGVLGLSWSLFVAGTPSCLLTQWKTLVNERTSREMVDFYQRLRDAKDADGHPISKAEALRCSQLELLKDVRYKRPYVWAPYVLIGDWVSEGAR